MNVIASFVYLRQPRMTWKESLNEGLSTLDWSGSKLETEGRDPIQTKVNLCGYTKSAVGSTIP